jgi:hypothetical protein
MKKIKECFRSGSIIEIRYEDGGEKAFPAQSLAGGISWPITGPYYSCFLAKANAPDKAGIYGIHLVDEIEENLPRVFHESIADISSRLLCRTFFAAINETTWDHYCALLDYLSSRDLGDRVGILRPSITNYSAGVRFVQGLHADNKLNIPKDSILAQQLGRMTKEAYLEANCHEFYAVQAFVNAIKYFIEQPAVNPPIVRPNYRYNE